MCMNKNKVDDDNKQSITTTRAGREREREEVVHIPSIFGRFQLSRIAVMLKTSYVRELYNREENEGRDHVVRDSTRYARDREEEIT